MTGPRPNSPAGRLRQAVQNRADFQAAERKRQGGSPVGADPFADLYQTGSPPVENDPFADLYPNAPVMGPVGKPTLPTMGRDATLAPFRNSDESGTVHRQADRNNLRDAGSAAATVIDALVPFGLAQAVPAVRRGVEGMRQRAPDVANLIEGAGMLVGGGALLKGLPTAATAVGRIASTALGSAVAGAAYGPGTRHGTVAERVEGGARDAAFGLGTGAILGTGVELVRATPKLLRLFGVTTEKGRNAAAVRRINEEITRSGQTVDDVTARAEQVLATHGRPATLAEALGDDASSALLTKMAPLADDVAGDASVAAREVGPNTTLGRAYRRAAGQVSPAMGIPTSRHGVSPSGIAARALTVGTRKAASREAETLLDALQAQRLDVPRAAVRSGPLRVGASPADYAATMAARIRSPVSPAVVGAIHPRSGGEVPPSIIAEMAKAQQAEILPETAARVQPGATRGRLRLDEQRLGLPAVTPDPPQGTAHLRGGPESDDYEGILRRALAELAERGQTGHLRRSAP